MGLVYRLLNDITHLSSRVVVTDYGEENPLLMDYYGFDPAMYELKFKSRGDNILSELIVKTFKEVR